MQRILWLVVGFALVLGATPAIRWLWDFTANRPRLSVTRACVIGGVLIAVLVRGLSSVPSTFIYFRF